MALFDDIENVFYEGDILIICFLTFYEFYDLQTGKIHTIHKNKELLQVKPIFVINMRLYCRCNEQGNYVVGNIGSFRIRDLMNNNIKYLCCTTTQRIQFFLEYSKLP